MSRLQMVHWRSHDRVESCVEWINSGPCNYLRGNHRLIKNHQKNDRSLTRIVVFGQIDKKWAFNERQEENSDLWCRKGHSGQINTVIPERQQNEHYFLTNHGYENILRQGHLSWMKSSEARLKPRQRRIAFTQWKQLSKNCFFNNVEDERANCLLGSNFYKITQGLISLAKVLQR